MRFLLTSFWLLVINKKVLLLIRKKQIMTKLLFKKMLINTKGPNQNMLRKNKLKARNKNR